MISSSSSTLALGDTEMDIQNPNLTEEAKTGMRTIGEEEAINEEMREKYKEEVSNDNDDPFFCPSVDQIPNPHNMKIVMNEYSKLESAISELGQKVSGVLLSQEEDFLSAYRTHMRNVKDDFISLKRELEEKEILLKNNSLMREIEKERDYYKKEALHLDKILNQRVLGENEKLRTENESLVENVDWLTKQLKVVMKQKASLEFQLMQTKNLKQNEDESDDMQQSNENDLDEIVKKASLNTITANENNRLQTFISSSNHDGNQDEESGDESDEESQESEDDED